MIVFKNPNTGRWEEGEWSWRAGEWVFTFASGLEVVGGQVQECREADPLDDILNLVIAAEST